MRSLALLHIFENCKILGLTEHSWIILSTSAFDLLWLFCLKHMKKSQSHTDMFLGKHGIFKKIFNLYFWPCHVARGILVPWPGIEPVLPAVEVQSLNHWSTREFPGRHILIFFFANILWYYTKLHKWYLLKDQLQCGI